MRIMKRSIPLFLTVCVLAALLAGCKKENQFQTTFPLDAETVTAAMEKTGLPGVISESETTSAAENHMHYVIRSETETFEGSDYPLLVADISSASFDDGRMLATIFDQKVEANQMVWEDWKQQFLFAAALYGGFENEEALYQAFSGKELPKGETTFAWDAQLPEGYCRVSYSYRSNTTYDEAGFAVKNQSAILQVKIYESQELYQQLQPKQ